ncbi:MAG: hypothetical protein WCO55_04000 [Candidatus Falkowbacteria bacterium]
MRTFFIILFTFLLTAGVAWAGEEQKISYPADYTDWDQTMTDWQKRIEKAFDKDQEILVQITGCYASKREKAEALKKAEEFGEKLSKLGAKVTIGDIEEDDKSALKVTYQAVDLNTSTAKSKSILDNLPSGTVKIAIIFALIVISIFLLIALVKKIKRAAISYRLKKTVRDRIKDEQWLVKANNQQLVWLAKQEKDTETARLKVIADKNKAIEKAKQAEEKKAADNMAAVQKAEKLKLKQLTDAKKLKEEAEKLELKQIADAKKSKEAADKKAKQKLADDLAAKAQADLLEEQRKADLQLAKEKELLRIEKERVDLEIQGYELEAKKKVLALRKKKANEEQLQALKLWPKTVEEINQLRQLNGTDDEIDGDEERLCPYCLANLQTQVDLGQITEDYMFAQITHLQKIKFENVFRHYKRVHGFLSPTATAAKAASSNIHLN